jgi:hypothetical protein
MNPVLVIRDGKDDPYAKIGSVNVTFEKARKGERDGTIYKKGSVEKAHSYYLLFLQNSFYLYIK